jgi:hypothetical protein
MLLLLAPVESLAPPRTRGRLAQLLPQVSRKPPQLELHGHRRLWGWLLPVFRVTDEELVRSAGLDALIAVRRRRLNNLRWPPRLVLMPPAFQGGKG